jgi:hypothetical protein
MANQITDAAHARILTNALYKTETGGLAVDCMHCGQFLDTNQTVIGYALSWLMILCWGTARRDGVEGAMCPACVEKLTGEAEA